jgi:WD40 repeat protein
MVFAHPSSAPNLEHLCDMCEPLSPTTCRNTQPGEMVTSAAYHPFHHELACGFESGRMRVFDVDATTLIQVCVCACSCCARVGHALIRIAPLPMHICTAPVYFEHMTFLVPTQGCVVHMSHHNNIYATMTRPPPVSLQEHHQHRAPLTEMVYSPCGTRLYSGGQDGALVVYDVLQVRHTAK